MTPAKIVVDHILRLKHENGEITPQMVVDYAKKHRELFADHFTWDVGAAAQKQWLWEARRLLSVIYEVREGGTLDFVPRFIHVPGPHGEQRYVDIEDVSEGDPRGFKALDFRLAQVEGSLCVAEKIAERLGIEKETHAITQRVMSLRRRMKKAETHAPGPRA